MGREVIDGGPAFPSPVSRVSIESDADRILRQQHEMHFPPQTGLSIRDYFAAHAPQPSERVMGGGVSEEQRDAILRACAENAYRWADAMLKAREA